MRHLVLSQATLTPPLGLFVTIKTFVGEGNKDKSEGATVI